MPHPDLPIVSRARGYGARPAIVGSDGSFRYEELVGASGRVAARLLGPRPDLSESRVAYLVAPSFAWVATQWGIWRAGGVAVPLAESHPPAELEYVVSDSQATLIVADTAHADRVRPIAERLGIPFVGTADALVAAPVPLPQVEERRRAQIFYTSGTTAKPKAAVLTHANLAAQVASLTEAWDWSADDAILGVLPLHHVHGVVNVLTCALWAGARCELLPRFDADAVWARLLEGGLTLFMAVPTVYARLIAAWQAATPGRRLEMTAACGRLRLMVSGSAALPVSVLETWQTVSGHTLLERYGMTEIGMALSNPLHGRRVPGHVGLPLPGVEVQLVDDEGRRVPRGTPGEIEVRGPTVFLEYLNRPEATRDAFRDDWFRTGDVAVLEDGGYRILGRKSVDIIKTGGYKVSALEIEEVLREHPDILECAVVGAEDPEWGERVCAAVVLRPGAGLDAESLRAWARERLAPYKIPTRVLALAELPRNAMGKVTKTDLVRRF
jgi:malonyl-CoA/methylmalonyl-CoA synthetase